MRIPHERQYLLALDMLVPELSDPLPEDVSRVRRLVRALSIHGPPEVTTVAAGLATADLDGLREGAAEILKLLRNRAKPLGAPVLVVEDDELVAAALQIHLRSLERPIVWAHDLTTARESLASPTAAVVCDLQLGPGEDGRDLLLDLGHAAPFIIISAIADRPDVQRECRALGADAVLPKPVMPGVLVESLRGILADRPTLQPPEDLHIIQLLRHMAHLTERDLNALIMGVDNLTWDAAMRTHLGSCDQCRSRYQARLGSSPSST